MGQWNITIRGTGCHHNPNLAEDANKMAAGFVKTLKAAGHTIHEASFTCGFAEDLETAPSGVTPLEIAPVTPPGPTG